MQEEDLSKETRKLFLKQLDSDVLTSIKKWFELAVPAPNEINKSVQLGCCIEECSELLNAYGVNITQLDETATKLKTSTHIAETANQPEDKEEVLDALCDIIVTCVGVAHMYNFDIIRALQEVSDSNWSKFENGLPVFNEHGKIAKGKNYRPPSLGKFV